MDQEARDRPAAPRRRTVDGDAQQPVRGSGAVQGAELRGDHRRADGPPVPAQRVDEPAWKRTAVTTGQNSRADRSTRTVSPTGVAASARSAAVRIWPKGSKCGSAVTATSAPASAAPASPIAAGRPDGTASREPGDAARPPTSPARARPPSPPATPTASCIPPSRTPARECRRRPARRSRTSTSASAAAAVTSWRLRRRATTATAISAARTRMALHHAPRLRARRAGRPCAPPWSAAP